MNPQDWSTARGLFEQSLELDGAARESFIESCCEPTGSVAEILNGLVEAHERSSTELEPPSGQELGGAAGAEQGTHLDVPGAPRRIASYDILRRVGAGGMGTIYEAQQDAPQRRVALKIMREGLATERAKGRFLFEAELLGRLQHENIARVLESGVHGDDAQMQLPWFALEFVDDARSLLAFADENNLSLGERLELFMAACAGVQHGHQKGVIHRDLKASNILVGPDGIPKVIDFGVACLVHEDEGQTPSWTLSGEVVGTLGTMSPEQLRGQREDVDLCTDVYSLGALLFELLAGKPALDLTGLSLPQAFERAKQGQLKKLREVAPQLPAELEWIVQRAMEVDSARRYPSVSELTADLRRFMNNEPVLAGPASTAYLIRKFVDRHRWQVVGAASVLIVLVGALAWISTIYQVAERERKKSTAINSFMTTALYSADPSGDGPDTRVVDVLDLVFERSAREFEDQPELRADLLDTVGSIYRSLGQHAVSRKHYEESIALRRASGAPDGLLVYSSLSDVALNLVWEEDDLELALVTAQEAYDGLLRVVGPESSDTLIAQSVLGDAQGHLNMLEPAERNLRASYEHAVHVFGEEDTLAASLGTRLGRFLYLNGDLEESELLARNSLRIHRSLWGDDHPSTLASSNNLAGIFMDLGKTAEALVLMQDVHDVTREQLGPGRFMTQRSAVGLGQTMIASGHYEEAIDLLIRAVDESVEHFGELHSLSLDARLALGTAAYYVKDLEMAEEQLLLGLDGLESTLGEDCDRALATRNNLAMMLQAAGRLGDAEELLRINLDIWIDTVGEEHPGTLRAIHNLGFLLMEGGRMEESREFVEQAYGVRSEVLGDKHPATLASAMNAAKLLRFDGELELSIGLLEEVLEHLPEAYGPDSAFIEQCRGKIAAMRTALAD